MPTIDLGKLIRKREEDAARELANNIPVHGTLGELREMIKLASISRKEHPLVVRLNRKQVKVESFALSNKMSATDIAKRVWGDSYIEGVSERKIEEMLPAFPTFGDTLNTHDLSFLRGHEFKIAEPVLSLGDELICVSKADSCMKLLRVVQGLIRKNIPFEYNVSQIELNNVLTKIDELIVGVGESSHDLDSLNIFPSDGASKVSWILASIAIKLRYSFNVDSTCSFEDRELYTKIKEASMWFDTYLEGLNKYAGEQNKIGAVGTCNSNHMKTILPNIVIYKPASSTYLGLIDEITELASNEIDSAPAEFTETLTVVRELLKKTHDAMAESGYFLGDCNKISGDLTITVLRAVLCLKEKVESFHPDRYANASAIFTMFSSLGDVQELLGNYEQACNALEVNNAK